VEAWIAAENAHSQQCLSKLPQRPAIVRFLKATQQQADVQYGRFTFAGSLMFALKFSHVSASRRGAPVVDRLDELEIRAQSTLKPITS
jgi:hypothetical protein